MFATGDVNSFYPVAAQSFSIIRGNHQTSFAVTATFRFVIELRTYLVARRGRFPSIGGRCALISYYGWQGDEGDDDGDQQECFEPKHKRCSLNFRSLDSEERDTKQTKNHETNEKV